MSDASDHPDVELTRTHRSGPTGNATPHTHAWREFHIVAELGHGAFGRVYRAWDPALARDIALKVVRLPDQTRAAAALAEGRMLARVRHRNVVTVYGAQQIGDEVGFWMELVEGRHLAQIVRESGRMDAQAAARAGISLCQALTAVHGAGLLHRDVKANNVMQDADGRIVLMDFGTVRDNDRGDSEDFAGTPVYMAPEVLQGEPASVQSDVYSLGVLLYFLVSAEYPVSGQSVLDLVVAHRSAPRKPLATLRPDLPPAFVRVVEHALAAQPAQRPPTAAAMMQALQATLPPASPPASRVSALHEAGRIAIVVALTLLAIFIFGLLTSVAFNQTLGREGGFSDDAAYDWWTYGVRSLVAPAVYAGLALMTGRIAIAIWQVARRFVPGLRQASATLSTYMRGLCRALGATSGPSVAHWLIALSASALLVLWWRYYDLLNAIVFPNDVDAATLRALAPVSMQMLTYRGVVTLLLVAMVVAWQALRARPALWNAVDRTTRAVAAALLVFALLLLEVPYRLLHQNERRRTDLGDVRCYDLGTSETEVLLYCPDSPPRIHIVGNADPRLRRTNTVESIFTPR